MRHAGLAPIVAAWLALCAVMRPAASHASLTQPTNSLEAGIRNAILRGDSQELRVLLEQAGKLSSSDSAIAQRALASMERIAAQDAKALAERYGIDWANKVQHALKTAEDGAVKRALFERYKTAEAIFARVDKAVAALRDVPKGQFLRKVVVDGIEVAVRGYNGAGGAIIGTIEKW